MGVHNLWQILKKASKKIDLNDLEHATLAIDTSIWISHFANSTTEDGVVNRISFLKLVWNRICRLIFYNILPLFVFDGNTPLIKKRTFNLRRKQRRDVSQRFRKSLEKVILSKFGLKSLEELKSAIQRDETIQEYVMSLVLPEEELLEDSDSSGEESFPLNIPIESVEFDQLDDDQKLKTIRKVRQEQRSNSKQKLYHKSNSSPDDYSKHQVETFLSTSKYTRKFQDIADNINLHKFQTIASSPTSKYLLQRIDKKESELPTITVAKNRNDFQELSLVEKEEPKDGAIDILNQGSKAIPCINVNNDIPLDIKDNEGGFIHTEEDKEGIYLECKKNGVIDVNCDHETMDEEFEGIEFEDVELSSEEIEIEENIDQCDIFEVRVEDVASDKAVSEQDSIVEELPFPDMYNSLDTMEFAKELKIDVKNEDDYEKAEDNSIPAFDKERILKSIDNLKQEIQDNLEDYEISMTTLGKRAVETVFDQVEDFKFVLDLFGIPYIVSTEEADAQCAYLEQQGFVDGILSDDSDILLFGGKTLIRNTFSRVDAPELCCNEYISQGLDLTRHDLIFLAHLLGSDYTPGIKGIGIKSSQDILSLFHGENGANRFIMWLKGQIEVSDANFTKKYTKWRSRLDLFDNFPNQEVINAYIYPSVKTVKEPIEWLAPNEEELISLGCYLGWRKEHVNAQLTPILEKYRSLLKAKEDRGQLIPKQLHQLKASGIQEGFRTPIKRSSKGKSTSPTKKTKTC